MGRKVEWCWSILFCGAVMGTVGIYGLNYHSCRARTQNSVRWELIPFYGFDIGSPQDFLEGVAVLFRRHSFFFKKSCE